MSELLNCPFCSGAPYVRDMKFAGVEIECRAHPGGQVQIWGDTLGNAIDAWNHRAALAAPEATTEPVAWRYRYHPNGTWHLADSPGPRPQEGYEEQALYAHPVSAEAVREACAKVCEDFLLHRLGATPATYSGGFVYARNACAKAIRALDLTKL